MSAEVTSSKRGTLTVVGTGIQAVAQTSAEAVQYIESADKVYFISADALTEIWIRRLNPAAESLNALYQPGKDRDLTYNEMVDRVLASVASGLNVCLVSYGHPGVLAYPTHEAVRRARREGYNAQMLPGISADACLFADLGIDPSLSGYQSFEATDFLVHHRNFDPHSALVLWQIGAIGVFTHRPQIEVWNPEGLQILADVLLKAYPAEHEVTVYEAARYACCSAKIIKVKLAALGGSQIPAIATLYVPPYGKAEFDWDMLRRLTGEVTEV